MYVLAIETTGPYGSAAVLDGGGKVLGRSVCQQAMSHLRELMPMIENALAEAGAGKSQIGALAVSAGPGSFTGIRIGVSTGRALAQALGIKAVMVPTLDEFLMSDGLAAAKTAAGERAGGGAPVFGCNIINARRGQVYGMIEDYLPAGPYMLEEVLDVIESEVLPTGGRVYFMGDGIDAYKARIEERLGAEGAGAEDADGGRYMFAPEEARYQDAVWTGRWALEAAAKAGGLEAAAVDYPEMLPKYMRKAEAEQKLAAGELPICKGPKQE